MRSSFMLFLTLLICTFTFAKDNPKSDLTGYDGVLWETKYETLKNRFRAMAANPKLKNRLEIIYDSPEKEIIIRRRGVLYRYVFYKRPKSIQIKEPKTDEEKKANESRFFFVESKFAMMPSEPLYNKLVGAYGARTNSTVNEDLNGAYVWNLDNGLMVQWVEAYNDEMYSRSIYYVSKKVQKEISKDLKQYQFSDQIKALQNLIEK